MKRILLFLLASLIVFPAFAAPLGVAVPLNALKSSTVAGLLPTGNHCVDGTIAEKTGSTWTNYIYAGGQRVAMKNSGNQVFYFHGDHLGSTTLITDMDGVVVSTRTYLPFGSTYQSVGGITSDYQYTGHRFDVSDGLVYAGARYYDPLLGRWITPDTIVPEPYNPQSLNRYSYVENNPINHTDPTGHSKLSSWWKKSRVGKELKRWNQDGYRMMHRANDFMDKFQEKNPNININGGVNTSMEFGGDGTRPSDPGTGLPNSLQPEPMIIPMPQPADPSSMIASSEGMSAREQQQGLIDFMLLYPGAPPLLAREIQYAAAAIDSAFQRVGQFGKVVGIYGAGFVLGSITAGQGGAAILLSQAGGRSVAMGYLKFAAGGLSVYTNWKEMRGAQIPSSLSRGANVFGLTVDLVETIIVPTTPMDAYIKFLSLTNAAAQEFLPVHKK